MFQIKICQNNKFSSTNSLTRECTGAFGILAPSSRSKSNVESAALMFPAVKVQHRLRTPHQPLSAHALPFLADYGAPVCSFVVTSSDSQEQYHSQYLCDYFKRMLKNMINLINITYRLAFYFWVCFVCLWFLFWDRATSIPAWPGTPCIT